MTQSDPYTDPATGVLFNLFELDDPVALAEVERDITFLREDDLRRAPLPGQFDFRHLRAYHRHLFRDIYEWAGDPRRVNIAKPGAFFASWLHVETALHEVFAKLHKENLLVGLDRATYLARFTYFFIEVNVVHPFREGNGRTQRAFFRHLAAHAGWELDIATLVGAHYIEACNGAMLGEPGRLAELFDAALKPI
ncbi:Cell filamentation protein fic [Alloactinosynnema sp. L-07]|uniref:Fic/DOC family protein n=1 Tax=Alloactinosynnema sp. L-07 TaxID=1653480 RepID=UPI00065EF340|nr:Fic family protein [Alloactinosynnema sp. L-07]CRK59837.1 Cell filamentation protein fic [Alloactinosynnema sp. L-07]